MTIVVWTHACTTASFLGLVEVREFEDPSEGIRFEGIDVSRATKTDRNALPAANLRLATISYRQSRFSKI